MNDSTEVIRTLIADMKRVLPGFNSHFSKIEGEVDRLSNELVALKFAGADPAIIQAKWYGLGMTGMEIRALTVMERAGDCGVGIERLMAACYGDSLKDWPTTNVLKVRICNIRRKLEAQNAPYHIQTIHGNGWVLKRGRGTYRKDLQGHKIWARPDQLRLAREARKAAA